MSDATLDLNGLIDEATRLLSDVGLLDAQPDGRVTPAADARTVRYYATLGLVDKPRYEGREARYSRRHVLQVVAVKALQSTGLPLAEIQQRLFARSTNELEAILEAAREEHRRRPAAVIRTVRWREVAVEPGLRILAEEGWSPNSNPAALEQKVRAALTALAEPGGV